VNLEDWLPPVKAKPGNAGDIYGRSSRRNPRITWKKSNSTKAA